MGIMKPVLDIRRADDTSALFDFKCGVKSMDDFIHDKENGLAVFNKGCMGSAVNGNHLLIPLIYSNEYMCGTRIIEGEFENEFAMRWFGEKFPQIKLYSLL